MPIVDIFACISDFFCIGNTSTQTLYSRNNASSCGPHFFPQSLVVRYTLVMHWESERREWRRIRNHNLFKWWDKERLNQFIARDLKIRQDVCTYVFHCGRFKQLVRRVYVRFEVTVLSRAAISVSGRPKNQQR